MKTMLEFIRLRFLFLAWLLGALGLLIAAAVTQNVGLALTAAVVAFAAGEERGGQLLCNGCAGRVAPDPETVYR